MASWSKQWPLNVNGLKNCFDLTTKRPHVDDKLYVGFQVQICAYLAGNIFLICVQVEVFLQHSLPNNGNPAT